MNAPTGGLVDVWLAVRAIVVVYGSVALLFAAAVLLASSAGGRAPSARWSARLVGWVTCVVIVLLIVAQRIGGWL